MLRKILRKTNIVMTGIAFVAVYYYSWLSAESSKEISSLNDDSYPHAELLGMINHTCSTPPFRPSNKPTNEVLRDTDLLYPSASTSDVGGSRDKYSMKFFNYVTTLNSEAQDVMQRNVLTSKQFEKFDDYIFRFRYLFLAQSIYLRVVEDKQGHCDEFAIYAIYKLLLLSIKMDVNIPIRKIESGLYDSMDSSNDHVFLMINTYLPKIDIQKKPDTLKKYIKKSKNLSADGFICDLWNEGLFTTVAANDFPLYQLNRSSSLRVITAYSLDFDVADLPKEAKNLIAKQLKMMSLANLHGKPTFFSPVNTNKIKNSDQNTVSKSRSKLL